MTMDGRFGDCVGELERHGLLPASYEAIYAAGSLVRGWGNERSDFDVYVIVTEPRESETAQIDSVALHPDSLPVESFYADDGRRWDVEYWLESQVDQLFAKVSADQLESIQPAGKRMMDPEVAFLQRFSHAAPIDKDEWLEERKRQLDATPLDSVMALRALHMMDIYTEDVVGQLAAGDVDSAVLTSKIAFRYAIDALLASHGEFGESAKWFARRFRAANPPELDFAEYWAFETMRSFDPEAPEKWIEEVLILCRRISSEVSV
jgi:hypothetical protein